MYFVPASVTAVVPWFAPVSLDKSTPSLVL